MSFLLKEEALEITNLVFEEFGEYLKEVESGNVYVLETQANRHGFPVSEDEQPVAFRMVGNNGYLPLYDRSKHMHYIPFNNLTPYQGFEGDIATFGVSSKDENPIGYSLQNGSFYAVYDISEIIKELNLEEKERIRFPIIRTTNINDVEFLKRNQDKFLGYKKTQSGISPILNIKEVIESEGFIFKEDTPDFPYCLNWFFKGFSNQIRNDYQLDNIEVAGYSYNRKYGSLQPFYDVRTVMREFEPKILNVSEVKPLDAIVPIDKYEEFVHKLPSKTTYLRHVKLLGMTDNEELVLRGPNTKKWTVVCNQYKTLKPLQNTGVEAEDYGSAGIKPCFQCFSGACQSSSGDSLCGGYEGHNYDDKGGYIVNCSFREYN